MARTMYELDEDDLSFHVVEWDRGRERLVRTLSASVSINLAIAAYDQVLKDYEGHDRLFLLKQGARVIREGVTTKAKPDVPRL
jgi:hypothetical protein